MIACGASRPLRNPQFDNSAQASYSAEGITLPDRYLQQNIDRSLIKDSAVDILHSYCSREQITLITLGPLTNLAWLHRKDKAVADHIERVVVMGGAIDVPGNVAVELGGHQEFFAEFNIYSDPEAAAEVFAWLGSKVMLVGKDACDKVTLSIPHIRNSLSDKQEVTHELMRSWLAYHERRHSQAKDFLLYDPLTVAVAIDPSLITVERTNLIVDTTDEPRRGQTRRSSDGPVVNVATGLRRLREAREFIWRGAFNKDYPGEPAP